MRKYRLQRYIEYFNEEKTVRRGVVVDDTTKVSRVTVCKNLPWFILYL